MQIKIFRLVNKIERKINQKEEDYKRQKAPVSAVETKPILENKQTIVCDRFSDDNFGVTVSKPKRGVFNSKVWSVKNNGGGYSSYCFLKHPKIQKNQILKWRLRVPKFKYGDIGMVIILE